MAIYDSKPIQEIEFKDIPDEDLASKILHIEGVLTNLVGEFGVLNYIYKASLIQGMTSNMVLFYQDIKRVINEEKTMNFSLHHSLVGSGTISMRKLDKSLVKTSHNKQTKKDTLTLIRTLDFNEIQRVLEILTYI